MCKEASTLHGKNLTVCDTRENRVNKPGSSWIKSNARAWDTVSESFETTPPFRTCGKETTNSSSRLANRSQRLMLAWTDWWGRTAWLQTREGAWRWFRWDGGVIPTSVFGSQRNPEPEMCKRYTHTHISETEIAWSQLTKAASKGRNGLPGDFNLCGKKHFFRSMNTLQAKSAPFQAE